jgi:hypothetical protein
LQGDSAGHKQADFNRATEQGLPYLLKKVSMASGYAIDEIGPDNLEMILEEIKESAPQVAITVAQNGDYINLYWDRVLTDRIDSEAGGNEEEEAPADDEDVIEEELDLSDDDEEIIEEEEEAEAEISEGDTVEVENKNGIGSFLATVHKIEEEAGNLVVRNTKTKKLVRVSMERCSLPTN